MSLIDRARRLLVAGSPLIGPGRLVLVVGPSGAGKDTLIAGARAACRDDATVVFPRRVVTRPASAFEDNDCVSKSDLAQAAAKGELAFWWSAHGHDYGIPAMIDRDIEAGRTVVCNVSRTVIAAVRGRYAHVIAVLVTAPPDILAARLAGRDRVSDGQLSDRLRRAGIADDTWRPDVIINNIGAPECGTRKLLDAVYATGVLAG
jgi:ribose 1,5-bisphosphokinase